jgi:hypothetical protein
LRSGKSWAAMRDYDAIDEPRDSRLLDQIGLRLRISWQMDEPDRQRKGYTTPNVTGISWEGAHVFCIRWDWSLPGFLIAFFVSYLFGLLWNGISLDIGYDLG